MTHSRMSPGIPLAALALAMTLAGCVTINIYFPAAAAEKAADAIIDEVWRLKQSRPETSGAVTAEPAKEKTP